MEDMVREGTASVVVVMIPAIPAMLVDDGRRKSAPFSLWPLWSPPSPEQVSGNK